MGRLQLQRGAPALLLAALLVSGLASAQGEAFVPDWAAGWKKTWLEAYDKGSLQLSAKHPVATPADWKQGDDVIIANSVSDDDAKEKFPQGWDAKKPYLRVTKQPQ